ncbi:hypothetical protein [Flavobacterium sp. ZB4P13]|uniref:hypothetical protein n=1 Tax=Flavobacterium sp. ZB4P13 TaxID=3401728 RepID=UPI003AAC1AC5
MKIVVMNLRVANRDDFSDQQGRKRIGTMYFQQSITGAICTKPFYFTENTDLTAFKILYASNQIYVPVGIFDEVEILEENNN